jgi:hypothetical protein
MPIFKLTTLCFKVLLTDPNVQLWEDELASSQEDALASAQIASRYNELIVHKKGGDEDEDCVELARLLQAKLWRVKCHDLSSSNAFKNYLNFIRIAYQGDDSSLQNAVSCLCGFFGNLKDFLKEENGEKLTHYLEFMSSYCATDKQRFLDIPDEDGSGIVQDSIVHDLVYYSALQNLKKYLACLKKHFLLQAERLAIIMQKASRDQVTPLSLAVVKKDGQFQRELIEFAFGDNSPTPEVLNYIEQTHAEKATVYSNAAPHAL